MVGRSADSGERAPVKRGAARRRAGLALLLLSTTALTGLVTAPALAADTTWDGSANSNWFDSSNWDTNAVPTAADAVFIDDTGNPSSISSAGAAGDVVTVGQSSSGTLTIVGAGSDLSASHLVLGLGAEGSLTIVNGGALNVTNNLFVGQGAAGSATVTGPSILTVGGDGIVAFGGDTTGSLTFSNGATGNFTGVGGLKIGNSHGSKGTLTINSDADVDVLNLDVGFLSGSTGTVHVEDAGSTLDIGAFLVVGKAGTGTLNINDGGQVTVANGNAPVIGANAGSSGTVNVSGGEFSLGTNGLLVGADGTGALNIANGGLVVASQLSIGDSAGGIGTVTVSDSGSTLTSTGFSTVGYGGNGMLFIANGGLVSLGNGAAALHVATDAGSIGQVIIGADGAPAGTLDAAAVEFGAGAGFLIFNHTDTDFSFAPALIGDGTLVHLAGTTKLTGDSSGFTGLSNVDGGRLYVNNMLGGAVNVNGGTLGGSGTLTGPVTINTGGTIAPGNSIGILYVAGLTMESGSTYEVELNDGGILAGVNYDHINATGVVTINGGTVHVTPENGTDDGSTYAPGATYIILQSFDSVVGTFDAVSDDYAFLNFYLWYDPNNVFLTSTPVTSFCLTGMTANQCATGDGVFSLGAGGLFSAVVNLSDAEAPGALDQLSGEIHASARTALIDDSRFAREAAIDRLRQASDGAALWGRAFGAAGHWDGDGNAAGMDRSLGGILLGGDAPVADDFRLGLLVGYGRSRFDIDDRMSSATADSFTVGAYGSGEWNGFSLRGGATYGWHSLDTSRRVDFTGFSDSLSAGYSAHTLQAFGEAAYRIDHGSARFEPFVILAHVRLSTDSFTENGGAAALVSAGEADDATFTTLGLRAETAVAFGGMDAAIRGMLGWRHAFGAAPAAALGFASGGDTFTIAGVPVSRDALVVEAGFDVDLTGNATLGLSYNGRFGSGTNDHSARASFGVKF